VRDPRAYVFPPRAGLSEPPHRVGEDVEAGELAGWLPFTGDVDTPPIELRYGMSGVLWMGAGPGRVSRGDAVGVVTQDYRDDWS